MSDYGKDLRSLRESKIGLTVLVILLVCVAVARWLAASQVGLVALPPLPATGIELHALAPQPLSEANRVAPFHGVASCNIGYIDGQNFGPGDATMSHGIIGVGGWLVDEVNRNVPAVASLVFFSDQSGQGFSMPVTSWLTRPDVQETHGGLSVYRKPGFVANADLSRLPMGRYHVYMTFIAGDSTYTCDNGRYINLIQ